MRGVLMNEFEIKLLDFIQNHIKCKFLDFLMPLITKLGDGGIFWIAVALLLICFKKTRRTGICVGTALLTGFIFGNLFLKNIVARTRPYDVNPSVPLLVERLGDYSFPSGHTLASFEAAAVLLIRDKRFGIPAIILAFLIALSRLYLYVHYPTDVIAGMLLGTAIAFFACFIVDAIYRKAGKSKLR